ncbi:hypothetical protein EVAR_99095_1 [Eumeta japonica]|uniref:Uncharacterized protein n=1 Tax=Eumeta variegata TaxID=151549 RepID=A0A4C2AB42_EUMVA|nr:hypothetical protein EVAR_99095_1 [Eumeta japonica]
MADVQTLIRGRYQTTPTLTSSRNSSQQYLAPCDHASSHRRTLSALPVLQQFGLLFHDKLGRLNMSSAQTTTIINMNSAQRHASVRDRAQHGNLSTAPDDIWWRKSKLQELLGRNRTSDGRGSDPPKLLLTGQNSTAEAATSRLFL